MVSMIWSILLLNDFIESRAKDIVIKDHDQFIDNKCALLSEIKADNPLDCLVKKNKIFSIPSNVSL